MDHGGRAARWEAEPPLRALLVASDEQRRARRRDQLQAEAYLTWEAGTAWEASLIARAEELDVVFVELTREPGREAELMRRLAHLPELDGIPLVISVDRPTRGRNLCLRGGDHVARESTLSRLLSGDLEV